MYEGRKYTEIGKWIAFPHSFEHNNFTTTIHFLYSTRIVKISTWSRIFSVSLVHTFALCSAKRETLVFETTNMLRTFMNNNRIYIINIYKLQNKCICIFNRRGRDRWRFCRNWRNYNENTLLGATLIITI